MPDAVMETLTAGQMAALLQVHPNTIYKWLAQDGRLPAPLSGGDGRAVRWSKATVAKWMEAQPAPK